MSLTPEQQQIAENFYHRHAMTPDEVRFLMVYRRLSPEDQRQVAKMAEWLLGSPPVRGPHND